MISDILSMYDIIHYNTLKVKLFSFILNKNDCEINYFFDNQVNIGGSK